MGVSLVEPISFSAGTLLLVR